MNKTGESPAPVIVLSVASLITVVIVVGFIILFSVKGVSELKLNEIGDTIAGPASLLAFVWLLTTVFLQRHEMVSLKGAAETQASSLEISARISLMTHLRDLQERYAQDLRNINSEAKADFLSILTKLNFLYHPEEVARKPRSAAWWLTAYFVDRKQYSCDLDSSLLDIKSHHIKKHFDYDAYLSVQSMLGTGDRVFRILKLLREFAWQSGTQAEQKAFEAVLDLEWYQACYPMLRNIHDETLKVVAKGGIANKVATEWINAFQGEEIFDTAWSDDWLIPKK